MEQLDSKARRDTFGSKINRTQSPALLFGIPWLSILLASLTPMLPIISDIPLVPPCAFLVLLSWRMLRGDILPLWAGFPLGLWDDLFSGQPLGSAIVLFSLTIIALDLIDRRFPWRGFWQNWMIAAGLITIYIVAGMVLSGAQINLLQLTAILPHLLLSIVAFPIFLRIVAGIDIIRQLRIPALG